MLFHETYGIYFNIVAAVLQEACNHTLDDKRLYEIIREKGFGESSLEISGAIKGCEWPLLTSDMRTPVKHPPSTPLTLLQKRWLKALLSDPRIKLFGMSGEGLENIAPLYTQDTFHYFDRYHDGDPFEDKDYISHFRSILSAIKEKRLIEIHFTGRRGAKTRRTCFPQHLEYSSKDDKFRLIATTGRNAWTINLGRVTSVQLLDYWHMEQLLPKMKTHSLVMELKDERNSLERAMLHFSHLEKETVRLDEDRYRIALLYDRDDETEMLIRVLSFGPMLQVISPDSFIFLIRERLKKQQSCGLK